MKAEDELNTVYCRIVYKPRTNRLAVNTKVCDVLTNEAIKHLRKYGINCKKEPVSARGGDGGTVWDIFKLLWEHKNIAGLIMTAIRYVPLMVKYPFLKRYDNSKPKLVIFLAIRKRTPYRENDWHAPIADKLSDLKYLAQDISDWLGKEYKLYTFDQHIKASISARSFRVDIILDGEHINNFNNGRIIKHIRQIKIRDNLQFDFRFAKFGLIEQSVSPVIEDRNMWSGHAKQKTYYTWVSAKLITRYPLLRTSPVKNTLK